MSCERRIPVTVLSGFLGSGKTTLINALMKKSQLGDTAILVNEIGEIGLDHLLISDTFDQIVLLNSGCICCSMLNDFKETLAHLFHQRTLGKIPPFSRVLVETTGLTNPAPLLQTLEHDTYTNHFYRFNNLAVTIDALAGKRSLSKYKEAVSQTVTADLLIVTKTDLTNDRCPLELEKHLRDLNPYASLYVVSQGQIEPDLFFSSSLRLDVETPSLRNATRYHHGITAHSYVINKPVSWAGLAAWTSLVAKVFDTRLLRCKGLIEISEIEKPVLVQSVQGRFSPPIRLRDWPDGRRESRLVCISDHVPIGELQLSLTAFDALPGTLPPTGLDDLARLRGDDRAI